MGPFTAIAGVLLLSFAGAGATAQTSSDDSDTVYSGTVETLSNEKLIVSREILGNPAEYMTFVLNPQTKVEGKLTEGVRVTVKFRTTDDGPVAETIIVREAPKNKKKL